MKRLLVLLLAFSFSNANAVLLKVDTKTDPNLTEEQKAAADLSEAQAIRLRMEKYLLQLIRLQVIKSRFVSQVTGVEYWGPGSPLATTLFISLPTSIVSAVVGKKVYNGVAAVTEFLQSPSVKAFNKDYVTLTDEVEKSTAAVEEILAKNTFKPAEINPLIEELSSTKSRLATLLDHEAEMAGTFRNGVLTGVRYSIAGLIVVAVGVDGLMTAFTLPFGSLDGAVQSLTKDIEYRERVLAAYAARK